MGYQLAATTGGEPFIAAALLAWTGLGYAIAGYVAACVMVSIIATAPMPDDSNPDISQGAA